VDKQDRKYAKQTTSAAFFKWSKELTTTRFFFNKWVKITTKKAHSLRPKMEIQSCHQRVLQAHSEKGNRNDGEKYQHHESCDQKREQKKIKESILNKRKLEAEILKKNIWRK
jgi:hypothetical protein